MKRKRKQQPTHTPEKQTVRPDNGQGSAGTFGSDGDWSARNEDLKKAQRKTSPIPIKER